MHGSRTVKTLMTLFVAMTLGAAILMMLETAPILPPAQNPELAAAPGVAAGAGKVIYESEVPIQPLKWRNIIIHSTAGERPGIENQCHFIIEPLARGQNVRATALWKRQMSGHQIYVPWRDFNADSIGICLVGDFSRRPPAVRQFKTLVELVRALQRKIQHIPPDHVYLYRDLAGGSSPGEAFAAGRFNSRLLKPSR